MTVNVSLNPPLTSSGLKPNLHSKIITPSVFSLKKLFDALKLLRRKVFMSECLMFKVLKRCLSQKLIPVSHLKL